MIKQEWRDEPNELDFEYKGHKCYIWRGPVGALNGYVFIPNNHPLYEIDYNDERVMNLDVHGGITFSGSPKGKNDGFAFGFDCAHYDDISPLSLDREWFYKDKLETLDSFEKAEATRVIDILNEIENKFPLPPVTHAFYKNIHYVKRELKKLVDQLIDYEKKHESI